LFGTFSYKDENTWQLALIHSRRKVKDLDSYLKVVVSEFFNLAHNGIKVEETDGSVSKYNAQLFLATGDSVGIAQFAHLKGATSNFACRICLAEGIPCSVRRSKGFAKPGRIRKIDSYIHGDFVRGIKLPCCFNILPTFDSVYFFGWDELHGLAEGICKQLYYFLTTRANDKKTAFHHLPLQEEIKPKQQHRYTFDLSTTQLKQIATAMEKTKRSIPTTYEGRWEDITTSIVKSRGVDYLDAFIYAIPNLVAPMFSDRPETQKAILAIVRAVVIALEWNNSTSNLEEMDR
jgi:hypothetical protein